MKEALDRFEETSDILEDTKNEIEDKVYEKIALEIERIDTEVNMNIEISDELIYIEYEIISTSCKYEFKIEMSEIL